VKKHKLILLNGCESQAKKFLIYKKSLCECITKNFAKVFLTQDQLKEIVIHIKKFKDKSFIMNQLNVCKKKIILCYTLYNSPIDDKLQPWPSH